jgi:hypothetical protein
VAVEQRFSRHSRVSNGGLFQHALCVICPRGFQMNTVVLPVPVLGFVIVTRAALAFGLGLLVGDKIPEPRRRAIGLALVAIGAATTVPAAMSVLRSRTSRVGLDR